MLEVSSGGRTWTFPAGTGLVIGRGKECDVVLDDPRVSRVHLRIGYDNGWVLHDDDSTGGTRIGDQPVREHRLRGAVKVLLSSSCEVSLRDRGTGSVSIGRAADNDVVLDDPLASRRHAVATREGAGWRITPLGINPVLHHGLPVGDELVSPGAVLTFGATDVAVTEDGFSPAAGAHRLVVRDVEHQLPGGKRLLSGVDLDVGPGELVAVIGPSGAGKSTFLKVLTGQLVPSSGTVTFDGHDVHAGGDEVRCRIGVVPQEDVLHTKLTARHAMHYAARLRLPPDTSRGERHTRVGQALSEVDMDAHRATRLSKMSGGQRKRVSIALELITEPPLLLLDEPTSGLDPALDRQVMSGLRKIANAGRAVVVVTHNLSCLDLCDRILLLAPGGVPVYSGPPAELFSHFGTHDWADVYEAVLLHPPAAAATPSEPAPPRPAAAPHTIARPWSHQAVTLVSRHFRLIAADPGYALFLLLLPVVLGLLALVVPGTGGLGPPDAAEPQEAAQVLVLLFVGAAFAGGAGAAREVVAERAILARERAAGLAPRAYTLSKAVVFGIVSAVQAAVLVAVAVRVKPGPDDPVVLHHAVLELGLALWCTAFASAAIALFASAVVRSAEQVMPVLVVTVMLQLVLCGGMIPVADRPVLEQLSWSAPSRWGYAAGASVVGLTERASPSPKDSLWEHEPESLALSASVLLGMTLLPLYGLGRRVRRVRQG
ncbi:ATP-binding cassette domain-containing protein [Lentzea sp. NEAU-D7]|uniref:ATP-binding cassette domain-containing protein n=1 Tax=Lentzea sp. NEAU-D7 TaxID=2994667 RepID=UPI00224A5C58|nr:ATP-binding cassette domain-containing protein [Lentzea sp. NEAU-D7]MCX2947383.1 ATP-binding cassette domain-containing protein [Lentzea sp. NEAU-D7]